MRVVAAADLHGFLPEVPRCDLLVLAGDLCPAVDHGLSFQRSWLDANFRSWLETVPADRVLGVAGNHDFIFERAPETVPDGLPWTYLEDESVRLGETCVHGTPWQPWFFDWAFNAPRGDTDERWLDEKLGIVDERAEILVSHGPAAGFGDRTARGPVVGSSALLRTIRRVRPKLVVTGHIHEGRGAWLDEVSGALILNASLVNLDYEPVHQPYVVDLDDDGAGLARD